jgi:hypothetical protein
VNATLAVFLNLSHVSEPAALISLDQDSNFDGWPSSSMIWLVEA